MKQVKKNYHQPMPVGEKLRRIAHDTLSGILRGADIQGVYPSENYPGWLERNAAAKGSSWKSTGEGVESFRFQLQATSAAHNIGVREAQIDFFFANHLRFVDMGVGRGRPISRVKRALSADHNIRYLAWNAKDGSTQRPFIMMEIRHQTKRMVRYFEAYYKYTGQIGILQGLDGITATLREGGGAG